MIIHGSKVHWTHATKSFAAEQTFLKILLSTFTFSLCSPDALHQRQPQLQSVHPLLVRHTHSGFADYLVLVCLASSPASLSIPQLSLLAKNKTNSELWKAEVHDVELQKYTFCHAAERLNVLGMVLPADQGNETSLGVLAGREPPKMAPLEGRLGSCM